MFCSLVVKGNLRLNSSYSLMMLLINILSCLRSTLHCILESQEITVFAYGVYA